MKNILKKIIQFILNPHLLICFGLAWIITNGWSYVALTVGTLLQIPWLIAVAGAYMTFLWFPFTPEKIVTVIISMALLRVLFPNDEKTLGILREMYAKVKIKGKKAKQKHQQKKEQRKTDKESGRLEPENDGGTDV